MLLGRNELTEEERLSKAVVKIMGHPIYVALAGVVMIGTKTIDESIPTACTNGRDCKFGRKFIDKLTDAELRFVVLHEEYHKLYRHMTTWKHLWKIDAMLANCAMDYVINLKIVDENKPDYKGDVFAVPPQGVLLEERFRDMDTAQVFDILQSEQPPGDPEPDDSGDNESGDGGSGEGTGLGDGDDDGREPPTDAGFDEHDWEGAEALSEEDTKDLERDIDEAIRQGALTAGKAGGNGDRSFDDLLMLTEAASILETVKPNKVRILYWGSDVVRDEVYEMHELDQMIDSTKPRGGGGTDVRCVTEYMRENNITPSAVVVLTDGYLFGGWGTWTCPVLWTILDNEHANPDVGKRVHIKARDM